MPEAADALISRSDVRDGRGEKATERSQAEGCRYIATSEAKLRSGRAPLYSNRAKRGLRRRGLVPEDRARGATVECRRTR